MIPEAISRVLGISKDTDTREIRFCCPFCKKNGKTPDNKHHLYINSDTGRWICFRCDERGSLEKMYNLLGIPISREEQVVDRNELDEVLSGYQNFENVSVTEEIDDSIEKPDWVRPIIQGTDAWAYLLYTRRFDRKIIREYGLGYGMFGNCYRIWIPVTWGGNLVHWMARKYFDQNSNNPKYMNPKEFKKHHLFNLDKVNPDLPVIICEGAFSAIAAGSSVGNAVALMGKTATQEQLSKLIRKGFPEYIVCLDGDAYKEAVKLAKELDSNGAAVSIAKLPDGKDPDELRSNLSDYVNNRETYSISMEIANV